MTLSEELKWRGFVNQTTIKDIADLDKRQYIFYWGVDPSSDSMTVGNLAIAMMVKLFIKYGHQPVLLVGGATGLIGDPDGKSSERSLKSKESIKANKQGILKQYFQLFGKQKMTVVDNYDWFKHVQYLDFLRDVGKHVPMRQMLNREFVIERLKEDGSGISYAEFSYVLIQAYDFLHLHQHYGVNMQVCGSDQWGNCIAGVDLIRRKTGENVDVWSAPLIVNPQTGVKFGKTEGGAVWLDKDKTSPTSFYQFWVNADDQSVEHYLKIFTELNEDEIKQVMNDQQKDPAGRPAQFALADAVTELVHGTSQMKQARTVTAYITGKLVLGDAGRTDIANIKREIPSVKADANGSIIQALSESGLASSNSAAKQLLSSGAVYINQTKTSSDNFAASDFRNGYLLLRKGKAYKDSALVELRG
jgi:tyrosyl-tRNA synthetase